MRLMISGEGTDLETATSGPAGAAEGQTGLPMAAGQNGPMGPGHEAAPGQTIAERHTDWPNIRMRIRYGPHNGGKDFQGLGEFLEGAQIFLPENVDPTHAAVIQKYANAGQPGGAVERPGTDMRDSNELAAAEAVYGTGIIVGHVDIDSTGEDAELFTRLDEGRTNPLP